MAFALPASSLSFAELLHTRSLPKRLGLFVLTVAPVGYGVQMDKAFYYSYVVVSVCVIACFEARRFVMVMASVVFATYVMAAPVLSSSLTPQFFERLVKSEEEQQSLGGRGGRDQLIEDGLGIWSRYPGLGVGPGNNYPYMLRYSSLGTAHNQYINILIELGVVGLACLLAFAVQAIRVGVRVWRSARERVHRTLALAWLGLFSGMLVGGFFGDFMLPSIRNSGLELFAEFYVQWIILGLLVSASAIERWHTVRAAA
jgi:O-antigen ligase